MKKKKYVWAAIGLLIIIGGFYFWRHKSNSSSDEVQYITETAEKGTLISSISASGNVVVDQQETVDPTITGTVSGLAVEVGDQVTEGQFLFNIVNDELSVSVSRAAASYESAKNSLQSAEIDKDNAEATYEKAKDEDDEDDDAYTKKEKGVLKDKIDLAESKIVQARMNADTALADYRNAQADAAKRKAVAPISGTINEINIKNGDDLSRTSGTSDTNAPIIIGDLETLKASVSVNEVDVARISVGQKAMVKFDALEEMTVSGKVEKIDALGQVEQGVVSYDVTISFDTLDEKIKPQMSVTASIITDTKQGVLIVSSSAVKSDQSENYVEVLKDRQASPERKAVEIGQSNDTQTEITSGIETGEQVVIQTIDSNSATSQNSGGSGSLKLPGVTGGGKL